MSVPNAAPPDAGHASDYWGRVADEWGDARPQTLWRTYCDLAHGALIERWMPPGRVGRVLKTDLFDEVVTSGLYPALARRADVVVGMDIAPSAAARARARHPRLGAVAADARRLPFGDASFDAVVSNSTLDHFAALDDVAVALGELARVLRPGGTLLLTLDNLANPVIALRSVLAPERMRRLGLVPYFVGATCGPARLRAMVAAAGFAVRDVELMMHCPRVLAVAGARLVERYGSPRASRAYLRHLAAYERLGTWPTRRLTGYFTAIRATR